MLALADTWVWDFWLAEHAGEHHIFYLQAPRSLGDPDLRHLNATVGHAVSADLREWTVLPPALAPDVPGSWDDFATWTGSIVQHDGRWWCFYTGVARAENGLVQRIGAAVSDDLMTWRRHPGNPLLTLDPARYEALDRSAWHDQAWRDPWVMARNGGFDAYLTARSADGPPDGRGVIAHASSSDLEHWQVGDPIDIRPAGQFGHLEVPQVIELDRRWYLIFCTADVTHSAQWYERTGHAPRTGTYYCVGESPVGPFRLVDSAPLGPADGSTCYSGRVVTTASGPQFLAWRMFHPSGEFAGEIIDPLPVRVLPDGELELG